MDAHYCWLARRSQAGWIVVACSLASGLPLAAADRGEAERALRDAVQVNTADRAERIGQAAELAPSWKLPRWYAGQIERDGRWLPLTEAQAAAAADPRLVQLEKIRHLQEQGPDGWMKLARYCAKHDLDDRASLYWTAVLMAQPGNSAAIQGLGMRPHKGRLMTEQQIAELDVAELRADAARHAWQSVLREWRRILRDGSASERSAALEQLRGFADPEAIPLVAEVFADEAPEVLLVIVAALGAMEDPRATAALLDAAVCSLHETVREAAIERLKDRSYFEYVPTLMGALAAPITVSVASVSMSDGLLTTVRLEREGPTAIVAWNLNYGQRVAGRRAVERPLTIRDAGAMTARASGRLAGTAAAVNAANSQIGAWNARIDRVLRSTTGVENDGSPQAWWDWWQEYNDMYLPEDKPRYEQQTYQEEAVVVDTPRTGGCECFLPGTPVWTETGTLPIERVRSGDRVLSQDAETGELAFKLVLQTTLRPATEAVRVGVDGDEIFCTRGHPFWVAGLGWRMARRLEPGMQLHTPGGLKEIRYIEPGPTAEAHNLVVADHSCYFVGRDGILVHDNTARRPTKSILPGIARQ